MTSKALAHARAELEDRAHLRSLVGEVLKFGVVGVGGVVVDIALFNVLEHAHVGPATSKAGSTTVAAVLSYFANRHWSFAHRARTGLRRELPLFILLSAIGLGLAETCLVISHYGLGYHSTLADNLSANGIGLILGTAWRFWSFKRWVFVTAEVHADEVLAAAAV